MSDRVGLALGYDPKASVTQMAAAAADAEGRGLEMVFFSETLFSNRDSVSAQGPTLRTGSAERRGPT